MSRARRWRWPTRSIFLSGHAPPMRVREELVDRRSRARRSRWRSPGSDSPARAAAPRRRAPRSRSCSASATTSATRTGCSRSSCWRSCARAAGTGSLVLAGAHVENGSSRGDEAAYLAARPELASRVHELAGRQRGGEGRGSTRNAAAIVYPTVYEGFGLIPFEAARAGDAVPVRARRRRWPSCCPPRQRCSFRGTREAPPSARCRCSRDPDERRRHLELLIRRRRGACRGWDTIVERLLRRLRGDRRAAVP